MGEKNRFSPHKGGSDEWAFEQALNPTRVPKRIGEDNSVPLTEIYPLSRSASNDLTSQIRDIIERAKEV